MHTFKNPSLLQEALTHSSWAHENGGPDYNRLEFLGDSVLEIIITNTLFNIFSNDSEGQLSKRKSNLVCMKCLAFLGRKLNLPIKVGKNVAINDSIISDVLEAYIGALYLDAGLEAARVFVLALFSDEIVKPLFESPKEELQHLVQSIFRVTPEYSILGTCGPDHAKEYEAKVVFHTIYQKAWGKNKKEAEQNAARMALEALKTPYQ